MKIATMHGGMLRFICAGVLALGVVAPGAASAGIILSFDPPNGIITEGVPAETLTVQVTVDSVATDLRGFSFVLEFDPTIVRPVSVGTGAIMTSAPCDSFFTWTNAGAIGDSVAVDAASLGCSMMGPGSIVEMKFVGIEDGFGTSPLAWREVRLRDSDNAVLDVTCIDGTILHQPVVVGVESETWGRIKTLYR